jgi:hypothetical protein
MSCHVGLDAPLGGLEPRSSDVVYYFAHAFVMEKALLPPADETRCVLPLGCLTRIPNDRPHCLPYLFARLASSSLSSPAVVSSSFPFHTRSAVGFSSSAYVTAACYYSDDAAAAISARLQLELAPLPCLHPASMHAGQTPSTNPLYSLFSDATASDAASRMYRPLQRTPSAFAKNAYRRSCKCRSHVLQRSAAADHFATNASQHCCKCRLPLL